MVFGAKNAVLINHETDMNIRQAFILNVEDVAILHRGRQDRMFSTLTANLENPSKSYAKSKQGRSLRMKATGRPYFWAYYNWNKLMKART